MPQLRLRCFFLLFFVSALLLFANSLGNSFVWDDEEQVVANTALHSLANWPSFFQGSTFNSGGSRSLSGLYYKPLMSLTYAGLYSVCGPQATCFHLFQVLLHAANACLVFLLLRYLLQESRLLRSKAADWPAFILALIFLIHPINVEAVVYIASMQEVLFLFFGLLALLVVIYWPATLARALLLSLAFLASLLSKETGLLLIILTGVVVFLLRREWRAFYVQAATAALLLYSMLRFGIAAVYFRSHGLTPISLLALPERLLSAPKIIFFYLSTYFWPRHLLIAQHWLVDKANWPDFYLPLLLLLLLALLYLIFSFYLYRHKQRLGKIWLIFSAFLVFGLGLHLQIVTLDMTVADRWFYLPQIGLLGLLGMLLLLGLKILRPAKLVQQALAVLLVLLIVALAGRTLLRNRDWRDGLTLYQHDQRYVSAFDLENNLGVELYRAGDVAAATEHFRRSSELAPHWWTNWNNLGVMIEVEEPVLALQYYQKAIDQGDYYLAYQNKARILAQRDPTQAITFIEESLSYLPDNFALWQYYVLALKNNQQQARAIEVAADLYNNYPSIATQDLLDFAQSSDSASPSSLPAN